MSKIIRWGLAAVVVIAGICWLYIHSIQYFSTLFDTIYASRMAKEAVLTKMNVNLLTAIRAEKDALLASTKEEALKFTAQEDQAMDAVEQGRLEFTSLTKSEKSGPLIKLRDEFDKSWAQFRQIDKEESDMILQKSNTQAYLLSFTEAFSAFSALENALKVVMEQARTTSDKDQIVGLCFQMVAESAKILALEAPHISEISDERMDAIEGQMKVSSQAVGEALGKIRTLARGNAAAAVDAVAHSFEAFESVNARVLHLSRINSDMKALTISMERKQVIAAECLALLESLREVTKKH
jgi:hypothetical protein